MTIREKVGNCISRCGEIANENSKVDFEWTEIKEEDFNFRVLSFYLTMLQYEGLGKEALGEIKECLVKDFCKKEKNIYIIEFNPGISTQSMPYPIFLQLYYLVCMWCRKHYLICDDFFYLSELYYKCIRGELLDPDEVTRGKEKCEYLCNAEFDRIVEAYGSRFSLGGKTVLQLLFNDICNSITNMEYTYSIFDSTIHTAA